MFLALTGATFNAERIPPSATITDGADYKTESTPKEGFSAIEQRFQEKLKAIFGEKLYIYPQVGKESTDRTTVQATFDKSNYDICWFHDDYRDFDNSRGFFRIFIKGLPESLVYNKRIKTRFTAEQDFINEVKKAAVMAGRLKLSPADEKELFAEDEKVVGNLTKKEWQSFLRIFEFYKTEASIVDNEEMARASLKKDISLGKIAAIAFWADSSQPDFLNYALNVKKTPHTVNFFTGTDETTRLVVYKTSTKQAYVEIKYSIFGKYFNMSSG